MKDKLFYYKDGTTSSKYDDYKVLHRIDGPAAEYANGDKIWYVNGKRHRLDGPALEYANGDKKWYVDGKLHRVDGPAAEYANGDRFWLVDGKRHRVDGPAVEWVDGRGSWYVEYKRYNEKEFNKLIEEVKELPLALRLIDPREWVRNYEG